LQWGIALNRLVRSLRCLYWDRRLLVENGSIPEKREELWRQAIRFFDTPVDERTMVLKEAGVVDTAHRGGTAVSRIDDCGITQLYLRVWSVDGGDIATQAREIYANLHGLLLEHGAGKRDVITQKAFFGDLDGQIGIFKDIGEAFFREDECDFPATTYIQQPPCPSGALCELQARVIFASGGEGIEVRTLAGVNSPAAGKVVSYRDYDQVFLHSLTGSQRGDRSDLTAQLESALIQAEVLLAQGNMTFHDVVRTWIYLEDVEADCAAVERARDWFFSSREVQHPTFGMGIQSGMLPFGQKVGLDLYAVRGRPSVKIETAQAPLLEETTASGSAFAHGTTVTQEDRVVAYVSGVANGSDRDRGTSFAERQMMRALMKMEGLLNDCGGGTSDIVRATTCLREPAHFPIFRAISAECGLPQDIPHTVCHADRRRSERVCEIEVEAVFTPLS
jgi:enamine deaminase RidA (YjgF/YER057c/UK114 family)